MELWDQALTTEIARLAHVDQASGGAPYFLLGREDASEWPNRHLYHR
jgi:hypothetical protein